MLIPIKPMIDRSLLMRSCNNKLQQPWNSGTFYEKGRDALIEGVKNIGLKKGDCIIVPALICYPVIEALRNEGYKVHLIDLNKNLSLPKAKLSSLISKKKAKAFMLIDYFGFLADENIEFTVTNSTVQADSVILMTMQDENTVDNTQLVCATHTIAGGSFKITVANTDSAQDSSATAVKIHFLVINNS